MIHSDVVPLVRTAKERQADCDKIIDFYSTVEGAAKPKLPIVLDPFVYTLTNAPTGMGDVIMLTHLPRVAAAQHRAVRIYSNTQMFSALSRYLPFPLLDSSPFWVSAAELNIHFDLGNGHFIQRLQRAFGFVPELLPAGCVVPLASVKHPGRVVLHFDPGPHVEWQRKHIHPRAREVYPENLEVIQQFINASSGLEFIEIGARYSGLQNVEDRTRCSLDYTIATLASATYFIGIMSGPMHLATALGLRVITVINFPAANKIFLPVLKNINQVESEWFYPQNVYLHQDSGEDLVPAFNLHNLERAYRGEVYPYWTRDYLNLINTYE